MSDSARYHANLWAQGKTREQIQAEIERLEKAPEHRGVEFDDVRVRHMAHARLETLRSLLERQEAPVATVYYAELNGHLLDACLGLSRRHRGAVVAVISERPAGRDFGARSYRGVLSIDAPEGATVHARVECAEASR